MASHKFLEFLDVSRKTRKPIRSRSAHLVVVHRVLGFPVLPRDVFLTKEFVGVQELTDMLLWQGVNGFQSGKRCPRSCAERQCRGMC